MPKDEPADQALIRVIAGLLNEQNLAEIEIEREDLRVRVTRTYAAAGVQQVMVPAAASAPAAAPAVLASTAPTGAAANAKAPADDLSSSPNTLTSPMVGTAYMAPEPGKPPYVTVGARVSEGQTILIIEAMKTMNQIPAHKSGVVSRILVEDSMPVEYGQPLAVIE